MTTYRMTLTTAEKARLDAADAAYVASLPEPQRTNEQTRIAALRALEDAVRLDQELVYPPGTTAIDIVTGGILPTVTARTLPSA